MSGLLVRVKYICFIFGSIIFINGCVFAWVLRDGLGPDSYESIGFTALTHSLALFAPGAVVGLLLILCGILLSRKGAKDTAHQR